MELHEGIMKNKELAEWFGITLKTFTNARKSKLEELKSFAEFNTIRGGVEIIRIIQPIYIKDSQKKKDFINSIFTEEWLGRNNNALNTCTNVAREIKVKYNNELHLKDTTLENYVRETKRNLFGIPRIENGSMGSCSYVWAKMIPVDKKNKTYICEKLTDEELACKNALLKEYFAIKNASDLEKKITIKEMVDAGEISKEHAYDLNCNLDGLTDEKFRKFLIDLKSKIGYPVIKVTEIYIGQYLIEENTFLAKKGDFEW